MKKCVFFLFSGLSLAWVLASTNCSKSNDEFDCYVWTRTYEFFQNASLEADSSSFPLDVFTIVDGDRLVFQFISSTALKEACCYDCGEGDWVVFEVDKDQASFSIKKEDFESAKVGWAVFIGITGGYLPVALEDGFIKGKKSNETEWKIELELDKGYGEPLKIKKTFKLQP